MDKTDSLVAWGKKHGAKLNDCVSIYDDKTYGISVRALEDLPADTQIVTCPFSISLSYFNALNIFPELRSHMDNSPVGAQAFPSELIEKAEPHVVGNFWLIGQYLLEEKSFWYNYIHCLPQPDENDKLNTPAFYNLEERKYLIGTQVGRGLAKREETWRGEWSEGRNVMESTDLYPWRELRESWSWELYKWAATIFSSRSFISSLIPDQLLQESKAHNIEGSSPTPQQRSLQMSKDIVIPVLFPLVDLANHSPTARVTWFTDVKAEPMDFSLRTEVGLLAGQQIFNNYAPKGNSQLLLGYGFTLPGNDDLLLTLRALDANGAILKSGWDGIDVGDKSVKSAQYTLRSKPFMFEDESRLGAFERFENGCIDHLILLAANVRERAMMKPSSDQRPEINASVRLNSSLGRCILAAASALREMLRAMLNGLQETGKGLGEATSTNELAASAYRRGQLTLLETSIEPLNVLLQSSLFTNMNSNTHNTMLLPLSSAFVSQFFDSQHRPNLSSTFLAIIRHELEISPNENLDWDEMEEDWSFTLWTFWVIGQLLNARHDKTVSTWISHLHASKAYADRNDFDIRDSSFCGEQSEWEALGNMVRMLQLDHSGHEDLPQEELVALMLEAGLIARYETIAVKSQIGTGVTVERTLMCLCGNEG